MEPAGVEAVQVEAVEQAEPEPAQSSPVQPAEAIQPVGSAPVQPAGVAPVEPAEPEPAQVEPLQVEAVQVEAVQVEAVQVEAVEPAEPEPAQVEPAETVQPVGSEPVQPEPIKAVAPEPAELVALIEAVELVAPVEPVEPEEPADPHDESAAMAHENARPRPASSPHSGMAPTWSASQSPSTAAMQPEDTEDKAEETPWPVGERRSAARQARKPLPLVLQAAVASGVSQSEPGESEALPPASKQPPGGSGGSPHGGPASGNGKGPGIIRRYGSAIAVVVLFAAAGGAAAGIAALRGPIKAPSPTPAQDQAAADRVFLKPSEFPVGWRVARAVSAGSYGVGSVLITPSIVHFWLNTHPGCRVPLDTLSAAMTPHPAKTTAVASSQATNQGPLGESWQIADTVAYHTTAAQVSGQAARVRSLLSGSSAVACIGQFWTAALTAELPTGSRVALTVSSPTIPPLPGNPSVWTMSMTGTATVGRVAIPIRFAISELAVGRAQVSLAAAAKDAPILGRVDQRLLTTLAIRAERFTS